MYRHDYLAQPAGRFGTPNEAYPTPDVRDVMVIEDIPLRNSGYEPLPKGTPRPGDPTALLVFEQIMQSNETTQYVRRIYATNRTNQDVYNFSVKYTQESPSFPAYVRSYIVRRDSLLGMAPPYGEPLTSVFGVAVASGGTGYKTNVPVTVAFTGGGGAGAAAEAIIGEDGTIAGITLTNGGAGYTSAPTVGFVSASGQGATATAFVQPSNAILVHQETQSLEQENPQLHALYVRMVRTYEIVPGPQIPSTSYDARGDLETINVQTVLTNDDPPVETMGYLFNQADKTAMDALRSTLTTKTVAERTPLWTESSFTVNRPLMRHITGTLRTTKEEIVPVGTPADTGFLVVESEVKDRNKWQSAKTTMRVDHFISLVSYTRDPRAHWALTKTTGSIVPSGTAATGTITIASDSNSSVSVSVSDGEHATVYVITSTQPGVTTLSALTKAQSVRDSINAATVNVTATAGGTSASATVTLTAKAIGDAGNAIAFTATGTGVTTSGATLSGGAYAQPDAGGTNVLESKVEDLDGTHALKVVTELADGESWPVLTSTHQEKEMDVTILMTRQTKAPGDIVSGSQITGKATGTITITGPVNGTLTVLLAGVHTAQFLGAHGAVAGATAASALKDTINALSGSPVVATASGGVITLWAKVLGVAGNAISVSVSASSPDPSGTIVCSGATLAGGATPGLLVTEKREVDKYKAEEITTYFPLPVAQSSDTAVVSWRTQGYQFPSLLDWATAKSYDGFEPFLTKFDAALIPHKIRTWWVISDAAPEVGSTDLPYDVIQAGTIVGANGHVVNNCLHDEAVVKYAYFDRTYNATTPSYTEYLASWGGAEKIIHAQAAPTQYNKLWKCEQVLVTFPSPSSTITSGAQNFTVSATIGDTVSHQVAYDLPEGVTPVFSAVGLPASLSISPSTGLITGTVAAPTVGAGPWTFTASIQMYISDGDRQFACTGTFIILAP